MKVVSVQDMRELDRLTIEQFGISGEVLMDRAGRGVADAVERLVRACANPDPGVLLVAGRGNNGGDAFAAARHLKEKGFRVEVWLAGESSAVQGDALTHHDRMKAAGIGLREVPGEQDWARMPSPPPGAVIVDGVLGTGAGGAPRGTAAGAVRFLVGAAASRHRVVAIDVPSGLNADNGTAEGDVVTADLTVTVGLPKRGLVEPSALSRTGSLEVVDIGIPAKLIECVDADRELISADDMRRLMRPRPRDAHKGVFGRVLIVGGSVGYSGAIAMAAKAAARSGAGLVTVFAPRCIAPIVAGLVPEVMVHPGPETPLGVLTPNGLARWERGINDFDALLIGPGMGNQEETRELVDRALRESRVPVLLDADAINVCAGRLSMIRRSCPVVLTPHPGEMARLLKTKTDRVQADRAGTARKVADATGAVVVLKGAGTLVVERDRPPAVNMTGNPGMASGGMGDVLGGTMAALAAQGLSPYDAACLAVYVHGRAGDLVAWRTSETGMIAGDVIEALPRVFREITGR